MIMTHDTCHVLYKNILFTYDQKNPPVYVCYEYLYPFRRYYCKIDSPVATAVYLYIGMFFENLCTYIG